MAVLGDDSGRSERGGRAQDRADIMRIGDLVEDEQDRAIERASEDPVEPDVVEGLNLDYQPLVRRVMRNQPPEVGDVRKRYRNVLWELHRRGRLARRPGTE